MVDMWLPESYKQDIIQGAIQEVGEGWMEALGTLLQEYGVGLADLELSKEDLGWTRLGDPTRQGSDLNEWSRKELVKRSRAYFYRDPLAKQSIRLWTDYTLGRGMTYKAESESAQKTLDEFWHSKANRNMFSASGQRKSSTKLLVDGEVFLAFFVGAGSDISVRRIDPLEITEIISDPDDRDTPILYKREWWSIHKNQQTAYYKDWMYDGELDEVPDNQNQLRRATEDNPLVFHIAANTLGQRGYPMLTPAMDWTKAHRKFLEDRASIMRALARFAWKGKVKGGSTQIAAMKSQLQSAFATGGNTETNPPAAAGSYWLENEAFDLQSMKFETGAKSAEADGRMLKLQVTAATGIMEHYFGDASVGNLASTKSMELPMLKMFESYQQMWEDCYRQIFDFVLENAGVKEDARYVDVDSPPIVEKDAPATLDAIIKVLTAIPALDTPEIRKMILTTLGINDPDEVLANIKDKPSIGATADLIASVRKMTETLRGKEDHGY